MKTSNGNFSILSCKPSNMGAFNIRYVGRTAEYEGCWLSVTLTVLTMIIIV